MECSDPCWGFYVLLPKQGKDKCFTPFHFELELQFSQRDTC